MSKLRPTLQDTSEPGLNYEQTYMRVFQAVSSRRALIHGQLEDREGGICAIGAYFREASIPISPKAIDEIAAYNDSFPKLSPSQRWHKVMAWLRLQLRIKP